MWHNKLVGVTRAAYLRSKGIAGVATIVVPSSIERVLAIAAKLGRSAADAQAVAQELAAFTGEITDEEIAARLTPRRPSKIAATVVDDDDLGSGLSAVSKLPRKGRR